MSLNAIAKTFLRYLEDSSSNVVLTGAGVSTASGIPDFRSPRGLYSVLSPKIFELDLFLNHPDNYYEAAVKHIHTIADRTPNVTHRLLSVLEEQGLISGVITQNIDRLHQKAGSGKVIELHGNVSTFGCMRCGSSFDREEVEKKISATKIPRCDCGGLIKPDIVFFGEALPEDALIDAQKLIMDADLIITMGTSLVVYPAAQFPIIGKKNGSRLLIVNKGETGLDYLADEKYEVSLEDFSEEILNLLG